MFKRKGTKLRIAIVGIVVAVIVVVLIVVAILLGVLIPRANPQN